jgi:hypothetical protein
MVAKTVPSYQRWATMRSAAATWMLVGIAVCGKVVVSPEQHSLWPVFRHGALGWWRGSENIYLDPVLHFRYSPVFAVLLAPFAAMPWLFGNLLFDLGGLAILFFSIRRLTRLVFPNAVLSNDEPVVLLLSVPGVLRCVWSSQAHAWSAALIFLCAVALIEKRWWTASFTLALAIHLKLAPIVLGGVIAVVWPRVMSWRLPAAVGLWSLLPIGRGGPARAAEMYREWFVRLQDYSHRRWPSFRDALHIFEVLGVSVPVSAYRSIQAFAGVALLIWAWRLRRRRVNDRWLVSGVFALTIVYMLLFGPTVEFVQYPLLAPWVSGALLAAWRHPGQRLLSSMIFLSTMIGGFGAVEEAVAVLIRSHASEALITLGTLGFGMWIVLTWRHAPRCSRSDRDTPRDGPPDTHEDRPESRIHVRSEDRFSSRQGWVAGEFKVRHTRVIANECIEVSCDEIPPLEKSSPAPS